MGIRVGIDASNIKSGGGLTHLKELLESSNQAVEALGIEAIVLWGGKQLDRINDYPWLLKNRPGKLEEGSFVGETLWKLFERNKLFKEHCDILFVPGGVYSSKQVKYVSMSQNMLVFERQERKRYGLTWNRLRLKILNFLQRKSFNNAAGLIFISNHAKSIIYPGINKISNAVIHHGVSDRFENAVKEQRAINTCCNKNPFKLLYISTIDVYKHQWRIANAIVELRREKQLPIEIHFVGTAYQPSLVELNKIIAQDDNSTFLKYHGKVAYEKIESFYHSSDAFIFGSTCENMPNILIEAMHSGLPILSSRKEPMPEFLKDAGEYFDPMSIESIKNTITQFLDAPKERYANAIKAKKYAEQYSWEKCAMETFQFIKEIHEIECAE